MPQYKSGLQRNISAIFDGAPVINQDGSIVSSSGGDSASGMQPGQAQAENIQMKSENPPTPNPGPAVPDYPRRQTARATLSSGSLSLKLANEQNIEQSSKDVKKIKVTTGGNPASSSISKKPNTTPKAAAASPGKLQGLLEKMKSRFFAPKPGVSTQRQIATALLIPILAIVFIAIVIKVFALPATKKATAKNAKVPPPPASVDISIDWQIPQPYPADLRDPMRFARDTGVSTAKDEFFINGIVHSKDKPSVIIGDKILHVGERIGDAVITRIDIRGVEFELDGRRWTQSYNSKNEFPQPNNIGKEVE